MPFAFGGGPARRLTDGVGRFAVSGGQLILLFVGIGYVVLWYFEERQAAAFNAGRASVAPPVRGSGDPGS